MAYSWFIENIFVRAFIHAPAIGFHVVFRKFGSNSVSVVIIVFSWCEVEVGGGSESTHDEVDVEEKADVEQEVGRGWYDESTLVDRTSRVDAVDDEQRHSGVPDTDAAQDAHRRQDVLVLSTNQPTPSEHQWLNATGSIGSS